MIMYVEHEQLKQYSGLKTALFKLRDRGIRKTLEGNHTAFKDDSLGLILDVLDNVSPSYILCLAETNGAVMGALRVLQTMGPHMLTEMVPEVSGNDFPLRSPHLWEMSRICVVEDASELMEGYSTEKVIAELWIGAMDLARQGGIENYVAVLNKYEEDLLRDIGVAPECELGRKLIKSWGIDLSASIIPCHAGVEEDIKSRFGIGSELWANGRIFEKCEIKDQQTSMSDQAEMFRAALQGKMPPGIRRRLQLYCAQQLLEAKTEEERRDAIKLMRYLSRMIGKDQDKD
jgi:acyl homoserine lactone synthase